MHVSSAILFGSTLLTGVTFTLVQGRGSPLLLAVSILVAMGCLVALTTGVRAGGR